MMTTHCRSRFASLRERILLAKNAGEITALLAEGKTFFKASKRTKTLWMRAAGERLQQLKEGAAK
jgi:hypothetical protein